MNKSSLLLIPTNDVTMLALLIPHLPATLACVRDRNFNLFQCPDQASEETEQTEHFLNQDFFSFHLEHEGYVTILLAIRKTKSCVGQSIKILAAQCDKQQAQEPKMR